MIAATAVFFFLPESRKPKTDASVPERPFRLSAIIEALSERQFGTINLNYFLLVTAFSIMTYAFVLYTSFEFGYTAEQNAIVLEHQL